MVVIRQAQAADVPALKAVATSAYSSYLDRMDRLPAPMGADYAADVHAHRVWVAECSEEVVGLVVLVASDDHLQLENVAVLPSLQGSGIGALLLAFAEERAEQLGVGEIRLYTNEVMTENVEYYTRRGYRETHRGEQDGYRRVFFRKLLSR